MARPRVRCRHPALATAVGMCEFLRGHKLRESRGAELVSCSQPGWIQIASQPSRSLSRLSSSLETYSTAMLLSILTVCQTASRGLRTGNGASDDERALVRHQILLGGLDEPQVAHDVGIVDLHPLVVRHRLCHGGQFCAGLTMAVSWCTAHYPPRSLQSANLVQPWLLTIASIPPSALRASATIPSHPACVNASPWTMTWPDPASEATSFSAASFDDA